MHISPAATSVYAMATVFSPERDDLPVRAVAAREDRLLLAPQPQRLAVQRARLGVPARPAASSQRSFDAWNVDSACGSGISRVLVGIGKRRETRKLLAPALGHEPAEFLVVIGEIQERCRGRPLLSLENQRRVRRDAQQRARRPVRRRAGSRTEVRSPNARLPTWSWLEMQ